MGNPKCYENSIKIRETKTGCHICLDHLNKEGYGRVSINKEPTLLHRFVYYMNYGEIPPGKLIRHLCNNPACVNPKHLAIGTDKENSADREKVLHPDFKKKRTNNLQKAHREWRRKATENWDRLF